MSAEFLDSNVFVYAFDDVHHAKRERATALIAQALTSGQGCISFQVVQEVLRVLLEKLPRRGTPEEALHFQRSVLEPLWSVMPSPELYTRATELKQRYGFSFYDALIVAAALQAGCKRLYSEDLQHGQRIEGLRIENPFKGL